MRAEPADEFGRSLSGMNWPPGITRSGENDNFGRGVIRALKKTMPPATGTKGRVACFEVFDMSTELERAILAHKPEDDLRAIVRKRGMLTMKEDAMIKSARGEVPFEEVNTLGGEFDLDDDTATLATEKPVALSADGAEEKEPDIAPEDKPKIEI